jgi:hypothetical protein
VQTIPGIGPLLGAVFVAEIGDIHRFRTAQKLTCWAGMTPLHRESDTTIRRGRITKQGSRPVRWAAVESVQRLPATTRLGAFRDALAAKRGHNIAVVAAARRQLEYVFYALRDHHVSANLRSPTRPRTPVPTPVARAGRTWTHEQPQLGRCEVVRVMTPTSPSPASGENGTGVVEPT